ncbi:MAG: hypothetical protein ACJ79R_13000 [Anaeromyxobacteraceae bacterium]
MSGIDPDLPDSDPCATCGELAGAQDRCQVCGATVVEASAHLRAALPPPALPRSYARAVVLAAVSAAGVAVAAGWILGPPPATPVHGPGSAAHATER